MKQRLSVVAITLAVSACGSKNITNETFPLVKTEPKYIGDKMEFSADKRILELHNLHKAASYCCRTGKKNNGAIVEEHGIRELPDVNTIMHPAFSSNDVILDYLKSKNAVTTVTADFFPGEGKGRLVTSKITMPDSVLNTIIHTLSFEQPINQEDEKLIQTIYSSVLKSKGSVMLVPVWRNQPDTAKERLYDIMVGSAYEGAKKDTALQITLFATSKEENTLLGEAIDRKWKGLINQTPSLALSGGHATAATSRLSGGETSLHQEFCAHSVAGAAADFGGVKLIGVMTGQPQHQEHTSLLVGHTVGAGFYAIGVELGSEKRELTYSSLKAATFYTIDKNWIFSAGVSAVSETLAMPFIGAKSVDRLGVMTEVGAHFNQSFQDIKLMGDVGARVFCGDHVQSALFGQVSLVNQAFKATGFVSMIDAGLSVSYED